MIPVHYRDSQESPIGRCEVETVEDIDRAVIDAFEKRWVVDVDDDGTVSCLTCDDDRDDGCKHEEKIRERLRGITDDMDEPVEEKPMPTPND